MATSSSKKKFDIEDIINPQLSCPVGCKECQYQHGKHSAEFKKVQLFQGQRLLGAGRKMHRILFLISGKLHISLESREHHYLHEGYCIFLVKGGNASVTAEDSCEMFLLDFSNRVMLCNHDVLVTIAAKKDSHKYKMVVLPIVKEVTSFFESIRSMLNVERMRTPCYHLIKEHELYMIMWHSYGLERLGGFFRDILSANDDFKVFVQCSYKKAKSISELAYLANFSESTFKRRFKETFDETYHEWLVKQVSADLMKNIKNGIRDKQRLAFATGFPSYLSFYRFCKRYFKTSPTELIEADLQIIENQ